MKYYVKLFKPMQKTIDQYDPNSERKFDLQVYQKSTSMKTFERLTDVWNPDRAT